MREYWMPSIGSDVYMVGSRDPDRRLFDALIPLPQGTTYNSYLVRGHEGTALVDTVNPGFEEELLEKLDVLLEGDRLNYIIMNHAEPDHAGAIPAVAARYPEAVLVATAKGASLAQAYFGVSADRIRTVADGDSLSLGGATLRFVEAPMLHWPETMFSFLEEQGILFSCDFFGSHTATGLWADEVPEVLPLAKSYFGEIMMPFRSAGKRALDKISGLKIKMIAPSHGPLHRDPEAIMHPYRRWTAGETQPKAAVVYVSMWGSTQAMVNEMADALSRRGVTVRTHNLATAELGDIAADLVDSRAIVLGSPTVLGGLHPLALNAGNLVRALRPPAQFAALLSSYGWSEGALGQTQEVLGKTSLEVVGTVIIQGPPTAEAYRDIRQLAADLSQRVADGRS